MNPTNTSGQPSTSKANPVLYNTRRIDPTGPLVDNTTTNGLGSLVISTSSAAIAQTQAISQSFTTPSGILRQIQVYLKATGITTKTNADPQLRLRLWRIDNTAPDQATPKTTLTLLSTSNTTTFNQLNHTTYEEVTFSFSNYPPLLSKDVFLFTIECITTGLSDTNQPPYVEVQTNQPALEFASSLCIQNLWSPPDTVNTVRFTLLGYLGGTYTQTAQENWPRVVEPGGTFWYSPLMLQGNYHSNLVYSGCDDVMFGCAITLFGTPIWFNKVVLRLGRKNKPPTESGLAQNSNISIQCAVYRMKQKTNPHQTHEQMPYGEPDLDNLLALSDTYPYANLVHDLYNPTTRDVTFTFSRNLRFSAGENYALVVYAYSSNPYDWFFNGLISSYTAAGFGDQSNYPKYATQYALRKNWSITGPTRFNWFNLEDIAVDPGYLSNFNLVFQLVQEYFPQFKVSYAANAPLGQTVTGSVPFDVNLYTFGQPAIVKNNVGHLSVAGYELLGWSTDPYAVEPEFALDEYGLVSPDTFVMEQTDVVLYAVWRLIPPPPTYQVSYEANFPSGASGSGVVPVDSMEYLAGSSVLVCVNSGQLSATDYLFAGWARSSDALAPEFVRQPIGYLSPNRFSMPPKNLVLFAVWIPIGGGPFSVTYNANFPSGASGSGSVPVDPALYNTGDTVAVLGNVCGLAVLGYCLRGWSALPDAVAPDFNVTEGGVFPFEFTMFASEVVLYGVWSPLYPVVYHANFPSGAAAVVGEVPVDSLLYAAGDSVLVQGNLGGLAASGYLALGWAFDPLASAPDFLVSLLDGSVVPDRFSLPDGGVSGLFMVWRNLVVSPVVQNAKWTILFFIGGEWVEHDLFSFVSSTEEVSSAGGQREAVIRTVNSSEMRLFVEQNVGARCRILYNYVVVFDGQALAREYSSTVITLRLYDYVYTQLQTANMVVNRRFISTSASTIFNWLVGLVPVVQRGVCPSTLVSIDFVNLSPFEAVVKLAEALNSLYYADLETINIGVVPAVIHGEPYWEANARRTLNESKRVDVVQVIGTNMSSGKETVVSYPPGGVGVMRVFRNSSAGDAQTLTNAAAALYKKYGGDSSDGNTLSTLTQQTFGWRAGEYVYVNRPDLLFVSPPTGFYIYRINRNPTITTLEVDAPTPQQSLWLQQLAQERLSSGSTIIPASQVS